MSPAAQAVPILGSPLAAAKLLKALGPYAAIELLLPGGSLLALSLWLYRRYRRARDASVRQPGQETGQLVEIERLHEVRVEAGLA